MKRGVSAELAVIPGAATSTTAMQPLLSVGAAARLLGISGHTLRKYIARGEIQRVKLRRRVLIDPKDLRAFVDKHKERRGLFPGG